MSRFFETIHVVGRVPQHLAYHERRMNATRRTLFECGTGIELASALVVPDIVDSGSWKCRVVYGTDIESMEFLPYKRRAISSLKFVACDTIEYRHKNVDRRMFESLLEGIDADDIVIVKNGLITDSSFSNLAFFDGVRWLTPAEPLLEGTARARLLELGQLTASRIRPDDLSRYSVVALINAMMSLDDPLTLGVDRIHW